MSKIKHVFAIIIALGLLFLVWVMLDEAEKKLESERDNIETANNKGRTVTTVIDVSPTSTHAVIQSYGEVKPHWRTAIKARKQGEVLTISDQLQEGERVKKGEVLFTFDNHHYQTRLAEAQNQIAQAELLLHSEKQQAKLSKNDWKLARRKGKPSAFALRIPQIKAAQTQLSLAKAYLNEVRQTASYVKIVAPYNGIVTSRSINLGDVVEAGQVLAEIISSDSLDIKLRLDEKQWRMLDDQWRGQTVAIFATTDSDTKDNKRVQQWSAIIERDGGMIDGNTRQQLLHLRLNPQSKPLVGSFVRVEIRGKHLSNLLKIPASAVTPDGKVWFVDSENTLHFFEAETLFSQGEAVFVKSPKVPRKSSRKASRKASRHTNYSVVVSPLSTYLPGLEVKPRKRSIKSSTDEPVATAHKMRKP